MLTIDEKRLSEIEQIYAEARNPNSTLYAVAHSHIPNMAAEIRRLWSERDALAGNLSSLGDLRNVAINRAEAATARAARLETALRAYEAEYENMEDRAPLDPDCIECNQGTGPHKRTCAHHLAGRILVERSGYDHEQ